MIYIYISSIVFYSQILAKQDASRPSSVCLVLVRGLVHGLLEGALDAQKGRHTGGWPGIGETWRNPAVPACSILKAWQFNVWLCLAI